MPVQWIAAISVFVCSRYVLVIASVQGRLTEDRSDQRLNIEA